MDIGSILLVFALFILVALFIARPLFERQETAEAAVETQQQHELSTLLAERDRTINALQELDFDFALGKIPEGEYPAQRAILLKQGAEVLRKLDVFSAANLTAAGKAAPAEDRLEAAIAARRIAAVPAVAVPANGNGLSHEDDPLETQIALRRRARQEKAAGFCPKCGKPVQISDKFCPKCGTSLV